MDYNNDGKLDLICGDTKGNVTVYLNVGTKTEPKLAAGKRVEADGKPITASRKTYKREGGKLVVDKTTEGSHKLAGIYSRIHLADWDADGLRDLLVGHDHYVIVYKNTGTAKAPKFAAPVKIEYKSKKRISRPSPYVVDWDGDGKKDLLLGSERLEIYFCRNVGTAKEPKLADAEKIEIEGEGLSGYRFRIAVVDWNNDGKLDLLAGNFYSDKKPMGGNVWLFLGK